MSRKKKNKNPAQGSGTLVKYALVAGGAYLIYRALRNSGMLGNGGYEMEKPKPKPKPGPVGVAINAAASKIPWFSPLSVARAAINSAAYSKQVAPQKSGWEASSPDLVERLRREREARLSADKTKPLFTLTEAKNAYEGVRKLASGPADLIKAISAPVSYTMAPSLIPYTGASPLSQKEMAEQMERALDAEAFKAELSERQAQSDREWQEAQARFAEEVGRPLKEQGIIVDATPPVKVYPPVRLDPQAADQSDGKSAFGQLLSAGKSFLTTKYAPGKASERTQDEIAERMPGVFTKDELQRIGSRVGSAMDANLKSGAFNPETLEADPKVKETLAKIGGLAVVEVLSEKAKNNNLSVDALVMLDKKSREEEAKERKKKGLPEPEPKRFIADEDTLQSMRLVQKLKPKLDEETFKVQEDGWAPYVSNGETKWKKIDPSDPSAMEGWRRQRADELASEYLKKNKAKFDAEKKAVDEFIAKRSPSVAKAKDLISGGMLDRAPRMTPDVSDEAALKMFQQKYGDKPGKKDSELTTDSYMRLIKDYAGRMESNLSGGGGGAATNGALPFILNDLKQNIDVLLPVFSQAADPTLDQKERFDRLKKFAGALDAITSEIATRSVPKFLATKSDAEVVAMLNQGAYKNLQEHASNLRGKVMQDALLAPQVTMSTGGGRVDGIDSIAEMEFGRNRKGAWA